MFELDERATRDKGMTLPELMIAVTIMALIMAVLSSALIVTFRQTDSTEGRLNVARAEQSIGTWMPADLASAAGVSDAPDASACPGEATVDGPCPGVNLGPGSNALLLTWKTLVNDPSDGGERTYDHTYVSYYYSSETDTTFKLTRIECTKTAGENPTGTGWSCSALRMVSEMPMPYSGWQPGNSVPQDVIAVTIPLQADATDESQVVTGEQATKNARRVIVTVHGGGSSDGAGGGRNTISITAGGTTREVIDATSMQGAPTFIEARSKCGGPTTLVIDESHSVGTNLNTVRTSVREFIKTLAGTPVRLQIVTFSDFARTLGATGSEWNKYYDLTNAADIVTLIGPAPHSSGGLVQNIALGGGGATGVSSGSRTNWEDALYRSFRTSDGLVPQTLPKTWIFFTDGIPSRSRLSSTSDGRPYRSTQDTQTPLVPVTPPAWGTGFHPDPSPTNDYTHPYYTFNQVAFNRALYWANQARGSVQRMVGVFVGAEQSAQSNWVTSPGAGYDLAWERGSGTYQQAGSYALRARYWLRPSGNNSTSNWMAVTKQAFDSSTLTSSRKDDQGTNVNNWMNPANSSTAPSQSQFNAGNTTADNADGFARVNLSSWSFVATSTYQAAQGTVNADIFRAVTKEWRNGPDWETWTGSVPANPDSSYRSVKVYGGEAPFDAYDPPVSGGSRPNVEILGDIIEPGGAVQAVWNSSTNEWDDLNADLYATTDWNRLGPALKAIALGDCGGTLTLQTRRGGLAVSDPFVYQNSKQFNASGTQLDIVPTTVTTNLQFTTGTFDFAIESGLYRVAEIVPHNLSSIEGYSHTNWECKAGVRTMVQGPLSVASNEYEVFTIAGSQWPGIRVKVGANQAISCTQNVTAGS